MPCKPGGIAWANVASPPFAVIPETRRCHRLSKTTGAGASLDVFWNESNIDNRFFDFHSVIVQPHNSRGTVETLKATCGFVRDNLVVHFAGRPLLAPVSRRQDFGEPSHARHCRPRR
jgi:phosphoglycerate dehydrogenase-like enzyme